jgi:metal-responsive CopG/Arc/MetJ family transcriptional regulator
MAKTTTERGTRIHVIVPTQYRKALTAYAKRTGINASEHIRRALEAYLQEAAARVKAGK